MRRSWRATKNASTSSSMRCWTMVCTSHPQRSRQGSCQQHMMTQRLKQPCRLHVLRFRSWPCKARPQIFDWALTSSSQHRPWHGHPRIRERIILRLSNLSSRRMPGSMVDLAVTHFIGSRWCTRMDPDFRQDNDSGPADLGPSYPLPASTSLPRHKYQSDVFVSTSPEPATPSEIPEWRHRAANHQQQSKRIAERPA